MSTLEPTMCQRIKVDGYEFDAHQDSASINSLVSSLAYACWDWNLANARDALESPRFSRLTKQNNKLLIFTNFLDQHAAHHQYLAWTLKALR